MPTLTFAPIGRTIQSSERKLLGLIVAAGLPIGRACEGEGICGACRVVVLQDGLSPMEAREKETLARMSARPTERLACCARLVGDSVVGCAAWGPL